MQKHVVKRQIIELSTTNGRITDRLQNETSRICQQRLMPLLDEICTELSSPDRIHRIDQLVIDLGHIHPDELEHEMVTRIHQALRQALIQEINAQEQNNPSDEQNPRTHSQLELLTFYLRTGGVPWWVDDSELDLLPNALRFLMESAPDTLQSTINQLIQSDNYVYRLVQTFDDGYLAQLAIVLLSKPDDITADDLLAFRQLLAHIRQIPSNLLRKQFWLYILHIAKQAGDLTSVPELFYKSILIQLATQFSLPYSSVLNEIRQNIETLVSHGTLHSSLQHLVTLETDSKSRPPKIENDSLPSLLDALERHSINDEWRNQLLATLNRLDHQRILSTQQLIYLEELLILVDEQVEPDIANRVQSLIRTYTADTSPETQLLPNLSFSEADEIYVHNAGLVILWQFLVPFFKHMGLVTDRQFNDEIVQHRAIGLLQYLVHPEAEFPEYYLPLNKVLCGVDLETVFDMGSKLSDEEMEQCDLFLEAVIAQAPILRDMSVMGFRGTFLLRHGVLSARDGAWLLRVEKETYDIVLEQFPWNWQWLKLPWMASPLRVEW